PAHPFLPSVTRFPEIANGFHPAEDFLHPFAQALADGVARMAGGPAVDGRVPAGAILGHMGYRLQGPERLDKFSRIVAFVTAHGNGTPARDGLYQAHRRFPLGGAGSRGEARRDNQTVAVLHQHMPHETELGLFAFALAEEPRLRVSGGGMGLVQAP